MSLYLLLDLAAITIPLLFSFEKRLQFYKQWKFLFPSILVVGFVFVLWDIFFTHMGYWGFNQRYLNGVYFFNLPMEEFLFFICIPYASVFTFHVLRTLLDGFSFMGYIIKYFALGLAGLLLLTGIYFHHKWYTCSTFLLASGSLYIAYFFFREEFSHFLLSYLTILVPFFIINGILTGSFIEGEVVWYNSNENLGIRIFTIPIEDIFYSLSLILWSVNVTVMFEKKFSKK